MAFAINLYNKITKLRVIVPKLPPLAPNNKTCNLPHVGLDPWQADVAIHRRITNRNDFFDKLASTKTDVRPVRAYRPGSKAAG